MTQPSLIARLRGRPGIIFAAVAIAGLNGGLEITMVFAALATFFKLHAEPVRVLWIITGHYLAYALSAALCGRLGDLYGRKRVLLIVMAICALGTSISLLSQDLGQLILGRTLQGMSGAFVPLAVGIVRESVPPNRVAYGVGIAGSAPALASGFGFLLGGAIVDHASWRGIFLLSLVVILAAIATVALFVPSVRPAAAAQRLDWLGAVLFVPALGVVLYGITLAKTLGWGNPVALSCLLGGLVVLAIWAIYEWRHVHPMINVRLLADRQVALANGCMALVCLGAIQYSQAVILLLQQPTWTGVGIGLSATLAGLVLVPKMVGDFSSGPLAGWLSVRYSARMAAILASVVLLAAWFGLTLWHRSLWTVLPLLYLQAFASVAMYSIVAILIAGAVPISRTSEAVGITAVLRAVAQALGSQMVGVLLMSSTLSNPAMGPGKFPTDTGYTLTYAAIAGICALGLALALALPTRGSGALQRTGDQTSKFGHPASARG